MAMIGHTVTARKSFYCHDNKTGCRGVVQRGEIYARYVAFPYDNDLNNTGLWVLKMCEPCATAYGQPMPPRRSRKRVA